MAIKKIYLNPGDMFKIMVCHDPFEANAAGFREQARPTSKLLMLNKENEICFGNPYERLGSWPKPTPSNREE